MQDYKNISAEIWSVFKKYAKPNPTDEEMVDCINEFDAIDKKYQTRHHEYEWLYLNLCVDELDKIWKGKEPINLEKEKDLMTLKQMAEKKNGSK